MTAVLAALAATLAAALGVGPWHRPLGQSRRGSRSRNLQVLRRMIDGRATGLLLGSIAGVVGLAVGGALVGVATCLACGTLLAAWRSRRAERLSAERRTVTEGLLDALAAELGSGAAPTDAVAAVLADLPPATRVEVEAVHRALHGGGDAAAAWRAAQELANGNALAAVFRVCEDSGASLSAVLARLAAMATDDRRRREEVGLALAGPRSSAVLLTALPALGVLAGALVGASPLPFLLRSPVGHVCFALGVGLDVLGARWVARLAASAGRPQRLT